MDISKLNRMLAYAQAVNILQTPEEYLGKRMRVGGLYDAVFYDPTEAYYHFILIGDEALCCQVELEFLWSGDHTYPDDYPKQKAAIEVEGLFATYEELGKTYYHLLVDELTIL